MASPTSKMLLIFCDGTGMDGNLTFPDDPSQMAGSVNAKPQQLSNVLHHLAVLVGVDAKPEQCPTNVLRLSRAVKPHSKGVNPKRQMVLYLSGVGSEADFNADPNHTTAGTILMEAFGTTVASKIRDAYAFLAQNYEDGDEICLFGFSRGAYTVRKVAGLIDRIGLLKRESLGHLFGIWRDLNQRKTPTIPPDIVRKKPIGIKCVGVWETVGSALNAIDALSIKDQSPFPNVEVALHALAFHENRKMFLPTLWDQPKSGSLGPNQIFKQVWFPGAHSDVGGGYGRHELSDLALIWMVGEIESFINIDTGFIQQCLQPGPEPWGTSQPHNSFSESSIVVQNLVGEENRLDSGHIFQGDRGDLVPMLHESLKFVPTKHSMITLNDLNRKFPSWSPNWAPLNDFEADCRRNWGKPHPDGPIRFTVPSTLFNAPKAFAKL